MPTATASDFGVVKPDGSTIAINNGVISANMSNKQDKITASGILKGNGSGGVTAATAGTDYLEPNSSSLAYAKASLAAGTTATLSNMTVHGFTPSSGASSLTCTLPAAVAGRCRDFILDINNSSNSTALGLEFSGLGTSFVLVSRDTSDIAEMTEIEAGAMARMYFTETALSSSSNPVIIVDRITFSEVIAS